MAKRDRDRYQQAKRVREMWVQKDRDGNFMRDSQGNYILRKGVTIRNDITNLATGNRSRKSKSIPLRNEAAIRKTLGRLGH